MTTAVGTKSAAWLLPSSHLNRLHLPGLGTMTTTNAVPRSLVRFEVEPDAAGGTRLALIHSALGDEESAENHDKGWSSSLKKFERPANQP